MVNVTLLNVRSGPASNAPVVRSLKKGEVVEIVREMSGWGEIDGVGWITLAYTVAA
jgi:uncharacterized protein YgiM (DUF1202 family)